MINSLTTSKTNLFLSVSFWSCFLSHLTFFWIGEKCVAVVAVKILMFWTVKFWFVEVAVKKVMFWTVKFWFVKVAVKKVMFWTVIFCCVAVKKVMFWTVIFCCVAVKILMFWTAFFCVDYLITTWQNHFINFLCLDFIFDFVRMVKTCFDMLRIIKKDTKI